MLGMWDSHTNKQNVNINHCTIKPEIKATETQIEASTIEKSAGKMNSTVRNFYVVEVLFTFKLRRFCGDNHFTVYRLAKSRPSCTLLISALSGGKNSNHLCSKFQRNGDRLPGFSVYCHVFLRKCFLGPTKLWKIRR